MPQDYFIQIHTWGTKYKAKDYTHQIKSSIIGSNCGHAALSFYFPADARGNELIKKYVKDNGIPYRKIIRKNPPIVRILKDENGYFKLKDEKGDLFFADNKGDLYLKDDQGNYSKIDKSKVKGKEYLTKEINSGEQVKLYEVYFSFFPGNDKHYLNSIEEDGFEERKGVDDKWNKEFIKDTGIKVDERYLKADFEVVKLKTKKIQLGPNLIVHLPKETPRNTLLIAKLMELAEHYENIRQMKNENFKNKKLYKEQFKKLQTELSEKLKASYKRLDEFKKEHGTADGIEEDDIYKKAKEQINKVQEKIDNLPEFSIKKSESKIYKIKKWLKKNHHNINDYVVFGKPPDEIVELPIKDKKTGHSNLEALDLEDMLKEMSRVVNDKKEYDFYGKNCSATAMKILESGLSDNLKKELGSKIVKMKGYYSKNKILGIIPKPLTPQMVYNSSKNIRYNFDKKLQLQKQELSFFKLLITKIKSIIKKINLSKKVVSKKQQNIIGKIKHKHKFKDFFQYHGHKPKPKKPNPAE